MSEITVGVNFLVGSRLNCLPQAVEYVRPYVTALYALVDDRAPSEVLDYLRSAEVPHDTWSWPDSFTIGNNLAHERTGCAWSVQIDTDEWILPEYAANLRALASEGHAKGFDGFLIPRRHWLSLDMSAEFEHWRGQRQPKLRRRGFKFTLNRVHPHIAPTDKFVESDAVVVEHFNLVYKRPEDFAWADAEYRRLEAMPWPIMEA